jgi:hypothetical protein
VEHLSNGSRLKRSEPVKSTCMAAASQPPPP